MLKKILFILVLITFSSCTYFASEELSIVQIGTEASCVNFELQDADGQKISLPEEVEAAFDCPRVLVLSPDQQYLLYMNEMELTIFDFQDENVNSLMSYHDDTEGLSCQWSPEGSRIACVSVNQQRYDSLTGIFILTMENGQLVEKNDYFETVDYVCGADCYPGDFWFEGEDVLKYKGHQMIEDPQEVHSIDI